MIRYGIGLSVTWNAMAVTCHDAELAPEGLVDVYSEQAREQEVGMTWMMQKETFKSDSRFLRFLYGTKLLHFGAFKRRF